MNLRIYIEKVATEEWGMEPAAAERIWEALGSNILRDILSNGMYNWEDIRESILCMPRVTKEIQVSAEMLLGMELLHRALGVGEYCTLTVEPVRRNSLMRQLMGDDPAVEAVAAEDTPVLIDLENPCNYKVVNVISPPSVIPTLEEETDYARVVGKG